jgi:hypothetical protein
MVSQLSLLVDQDRNPSINHMDTSGQLCLFVDLNRNLSIKTLESQLCLFVDLNENPSIKTYRQPALSPCWSKQKAIYQPSINHVGSPASPLN